MAGKKARQKMAENEVVFRERNKRALNYVEELKDIADGESDKEYLRHDDSPLFFYCECSDENCQERIPVKPSEFSRVHERNDLFIILPGHESEVIEKIVEKNDGYQVVRKYLNPPTDATTLRSTE